MITTEGYRQIHGFIADRLHDLGPAAMGDPLPRAAVAQLVVHEELLPYRDRPDLGGRDTGFIDGFGLAVLHIAANFRDHPHYRAEWEPPRVEGRHLLEGDYDLPDDGATGPAPA